MLRIGIVGAGLMGRTAAVEAVMRGHQVTIFDPDLPACRRSCGYAGAGMLAPYSELETAHPFVFEFGQTSFDRWKRLVDFLDEPVYMQQEGTLVIAHSRDEDSVRSFVRLVSGKLKQLGKSTLHLERLDRNGMEKLEPELVDTFPSGTFVPDEGQIDNRQLMSAMLAKLLSSRNAVAISESVTALGAGFVQANGERIGFDWVIDCRGLFARQSIRSLRGVRGELVEVHAPTVHLGRPVRLMHPRYPIYIVPRENGRFLIGATAFESDDLRPITVESMLELLSAAFSLHAGFAQASILECRVNCRPALPDNLPKITVGDKLMTINGLFRHGFLAAPFLAQTAFDLIEHTRIEPRFTELISEEAMSIASIC